MATALEQYGASDRYREDLLVLVEAFRYELCEECLRDVEAHSFAPDPMGKPHAYCLTTSPTED